MTDKDLQAIKKRYEKIEFTGAWSVLEDEEYRDRDKVVAKTYIVASEMHEDDAEFVAHAKQDIPNLVAEVEYLEELVRQYEARLVEKNFEVEHLKRKLDRTELAEMKARMEIERLQKGLDEILDLDNFGGMDAEYYKKLAAKAIVVACKALEGTI